MKVSIITAVLNNVGTIRDTIESVLSQTYEDIEHIIIDGNSTDGTLNIIKEYEDKIKIAVSENDDGLYSALNKGLDLATGDIIGVLHSDDFYINNHVLEDVVNEFVEKQVDTVFADLVYVKANNLNKIVRYYSAKGFNKDKIKFGLMPPHPTLFIKKIIYEKYGLYKTDYQIAGDYEMVVRIYTDSSVSYSYIQKPLIVMRVGGISTGGIKSKLLINRESLKALKANGVNANIFNILRKYPFKLYEVIKGKCRSDISRYSK